MLVVEMHISLLPKGNPEDLIFFYRHLSYGGKLLRIDEPLLTYRYHKDAVSFGVDRSEMLTIVKHLY